MNELESLYESLTGSAPSSVVPLAGEGSARRYWRLTGVRDVVGAVGTSRRENDAFVYLSGFFRAHGLPVPEVLAVSADGMTYLQQDVGDTSLYSLIAAAGGDWPAVEPLLHRVMELLPRFQTSASDVSFDLSRCYPRQAMDRRAAMWDLNYFKYCFLKPSGVEFDEDCLEDDFQTLAEAAADNPDGLLMLRDCQSRNVMIDGSGNPYFIDFQGARFGDGLYDVASFVWQARAGFPAELRERLVDTYRSALARELGYEPAGFSRRLEVMVLFRILQTLGAYGFRGFVEHKAQFLTTIPQAIANLRESLERLPDGFVPYLAEVLRTMTSLPRFAARGDADGLTVTVMSFSYKKGMPEDASGNGGGFVFDCRGMHNPGRYEQYKPLTGRDRPVIEFLEQRGEIQPFLEHCYALVDPSVECYMRRGFTDLMVCFGCTGGRHRSVYGAEHMARHLSERYGVRVRLVHREQGIEEVFQPVSSIRP